MVDLLLNVVSLILVILEAHRNQVFSLLAHFCVVSVFQSMPLNEFEFLHSDCSERSLTHQEFI